MYQLTETPGMVLRIADLAGIPADERNADYQAFLAWQAQGNTPAPHVPAPAPVPSIVTRRQGRRALVLMDKLHLVQPIIDAIPSDKLRALVQVDWDDASVFDRDDPSLQLISDLLEIDLDAVFTLAAQQ